MQPEGDPGLPKSYVIRRVIRVEDSRMWRRYLARRQRLRSEEKLLDVETTRLVDEQPDVFMPVDKDVNEFYLWHGTHIRAALSIAHEDFRIDMAGSNAGTMYGKGCYLAENCRLA